MLEAFRLACRLRAGQRRRAGQHNNTPDTSARRSYVHAAGKSRHPDRLSISSHHRHGQNTTPWQTERTLRALSEHRTPTEEGTKQNQQAGSLPTRLPTSTKIGSLIGRAPPEADASRDTSPSGVPDPTPPTAHWIYHPIPSLPSTYTPAPPVPIASPRLLHPLASQDCPTLHPCKLRGSRRSVYNDRQPGFPPHRPSPLPSSAKIHRSTAPTCVASPRNTIHTWTTPQPLERLIASHTTTASRLAASPTGHRAALRLVQHV